MAKHVLGRGIEALLGPAQAGEAPQQSAEQAPTPAEGQVILASVDQLVPSRHQPRQAMGEKALEELAESIRRTGVLQPILVRALGEKLEIVVGHRRWEAAKRAGLRAVPVVVRDLDESELLPLALVENLQREDLNPLEVAEAFHRLAQESGWTQEELAQAVGKDRATVANYLRLLELPEEVKGYLRSRQMGMGHARALLGLPDREKQVELAREVVRSRLSVREVERRVRRATRRQIKRRPAQVPARALLGRVEEMIQRQLGTRVRLRGSAEKGTIEIEYYSRDELNRILEQFGVHV